MAFFRHGDRAANLAEAGPPLRAGDRRADRVGSSVERVLRSPDPGEPDAREADAADRRRHRGVAPSLQRLDRERRAEAPDAALAGRAEGRPAREAARGEPGRARRMTATGASTGPDLVARLHREVERSMLRARNG